MAEHPNDPLDLSSLNEFSQTVATALFRAFPNWRDCARTDPHDHAAVVVEVSNPNDELWPLEISTAEEEITISVPGWHCHFEAGEADDEVIVEALEFLTSYFADGIVVVVATRNGSWSRSWSAEPGRELQRAALRYGEVASVRSWSGCHNKRLTQADEAWRAQAPDTPK